jgi:hAT family C-terminal dimerisation region
MVPLFQILTARHEKKDATWIKDQCLAVMQDVKVQTGATVSGFVMDSASANRTAMDLMEVEAGPLINLPCVSHTLSLLLKDVDKKFGWVKQLYQIALDASATVNNSEKLTALLASAGLRTERGKECYLASHSETRFGSKHLVLRSVVAAKDSFFNMFADKEFRDLVPKNKQARDLRTSLNSDGEGEFWDLANVYESFAACVMTAMHKLEGDKPLLSSVMPMLNEIEKSAERFSLAYPALSKGDTSVKDSMSLEEVVNKRMRVFYYKPCHAGAYMLDPVHFVRCSVRTSKVLPPKNKLTAQECEDALTDIARLGGDEAKTELIQLTTSGFEPRDVFETAVFDAVVPMGGEMGAQYPSVMDRQAAWQAIGTRYSKLAGVARKYLGQHTTSCASERNLSKFGRLFDKSRSALKLKKAEKIVFIASSELLCKDHRTEEERLFDDLEALYDSDDMMVEQVDV